MRDKYVIPKDLIPSGSEFIKLSPEKQQDWIKLIFSNSYKVPGVFELARRMKFNDDYNLRKSLMSWKNPEGEK